MAEGVRIYNLFPLLVGSIDKWEKHLDRIAGMGFNWVFLNPIHECGASGSLYAVRDYYTLNPLFRSPGKKSDDDKIAAFAAAAKKRGLSVMMDLVVNHTGIDSVLTERHPDWFVHEADGSFMRPFALDPGNPNSKTVWEDLAEIDYSHRPQRTDVIGYFGQMIQHYLKLGIRGFRCDAAYKVSSDVWRELMDYGRAVDPQALFIAESLGAMQEQVEQLRSAGFAYLFNSAKWWNFRDGWLLDQYEKFRSIAPSIAFPETHDTTRFAGDLRNQGVGQPAEIARRCRNAYLFSATFSSGVMIPIGFEFAFSKQLHVVKTRPNDWESEEIDLTGFIADVNRMKAGIPALNEEGPQTVLRLGDDRAVCLLRRTNDGGHWCLTIINSNPSVPVTIRLDGLDGGLSAGTEKTPGYPAIALTPGMDVALKPGEVRVFAPK